MKPAVLVTGAHGFLGQHLVQALFDAGIPNVVTINRNLHEPNWKYSTDQQLSAFIGNLTDSQFVHRAVAFGGDIQVIFHLAANPIVKLDEGDQSQITKDNILATHNLLAAAPKGCKFVFASSATVYGSSLNTGGAFVSEITPTRPNSVYGATKLAAEALVNAYTALGRVKGVNLRLVANVGSGATHGLMKDIIAKLHSDAPGLELLGDAPGSTKPFLHVKDTCDAFIRAAFDPRWCSQEVVNISPTTVLTVEEFANIVMDETGIHKPIKWLGEGANWKGDNRLVKLSADRATWNGWHPRSSEAAVRQAVKDILSA
jgi:UDP-glucose 4-epimerase